MNSHYSDLKSIFVDGEVFDYINLDKAALTYDKLIQTLDKPLKLILFYGKPGTGKTFLLQKIYNDLRQKSVLFFFQDLFSTKKFLLKLYTKQRLAKLLRNFPIIMSF